MTPTYFEDLRLGQWLRIGEWQIQARDAVAFARRWEPQPHHVDPAAARSYGGLTVCSLYLFAVCTRLFFAYKNPIAVRAMLGKTDVVLPHPARPGDRLRYESRCIYKRRSRSRPELGIVTLEDRLATRRGPVLTQKVRLLVSRRPAGSLGPLA